MADENGRDPRSIEITIFAQPPERDVVESFVDGGADRVVVMLRGADSTEECVSVLEKIAEDILN